MGRSQLRVRKQNIVLATAALALVCLLLLLLAGKGIGLPCVLHLLTGLQCPGCGNTRAVVALFRGDILGMLRYNFLLPAELAYLARIYFCVCKAYYETGRAVYAPKKLFWDYFLLGLLLLWGVVRNLL